MVQKYTFFCTFAPAKPTSMRPVVTLISDWRTRDPYVAIFKGKLLSAIPDAEIIDISHVVDLYNINQTAFLTLQSYRNFPEGSIHILLTNASATSAFAPVVVEYDGHFFIGEDNGIFCIMFNLHFPITGHQYSGSTPGALDRIIELTQAVKEDKMDYVTTEYTNFKRMFAALPIHFDNDRTIEGEIVYIDAYFNAITNIPVTMFKEAVRSGTFQATIHSKKEWKCQIYHESYSPEEEFYFTGNALGCLEIAMYQGNVAILADFKVGDKITIKY